MLRSTLKIALRHLWQSKLCSAINIIGLSLAIACVLLAVLYWKEERSFDRFHANNPHLYRITTTLAEDKQDKIHERGGTGQVQGPAFKTGAPEVIDFTRVMGGTIFGDVQAGDKVLRLNTMFADPNFFSTFTFPFLRGNPQTALEDIGSAVITETTARKYFNSIDVLGKSLRMEADPSAKQLGKPMVITGVVKDPPKNSSIRFDALFPLKFMQLSFEDNSWLNAYLGTYILLRPNADPKAVTQKFDRIYASMAKEQLVENIKNYGFDPHVSYGLQPITDTHLDPLAISNGQMEAGITNGSSPVYSYMLMGIALFILLMAGINFVNISLADSLKRAKEVGLRKIIGGSRSGIIGQFLAESAILCLAAFLLAGFLSYASLTVFNNLTGRQIAWRDSLDAGLFLSLITILVLIIGLAGLYPAKILSRFKATEALYNRQRLSGRNGFGRSLVVVQFSLAIGMLIATFVYYEQMDYIQTKDLGYNPRQVILTTIQGDRDIKTARDAFRNELKSDPSIGEVSFGGDRIDPSEVKLLDRPAQASPSSPTTPSSSTTPSGPSTPSGQAIPYGPSTPSGQAAPPMQPAYSVQAIHKVIDEDYLSLMQIPLKAGRNLSSSIPADKSRSVIVNEAFVKMAHLENPIGARVQTDEYFDKEPKTIIGVVKDFHTGSLREPIRPTVLFMSDWFGGDVWVRFEKAKQKQAMQALEKAYRKAMPGAAYQYDFMDERNAKEYTGEKRWQQVIRSAAFISMTICAIGLFGLAWLSTRRRTREIGIRKVLGASAKQIVTLLTGDFLKLVSIAYIVAAPIAWLLMNKWLETFAYRISIGPGTFLLAGLSAAVIACVSVSFQSMIAAVSNPVDSLKWE